MERKIVLTILGILFFGATKLGAQADTYMLPYRGPVYEAIPEKSVQVELLSPEEVNAGAKVKACKDCKYPLSLQNHKTFRSDTLIGRSVSWVPKMEDTSQQVHVIRYWIVYKDGNSRMDAVRVKVFSFPQRLSHHFKSDDQGRLDFAIEVNLWTENVEIDIIDENGRVVEQLKDIYKGKLDLPEGHYRAKTRLTTTFPILTNFTDTFSIRRPEKEEISPIVSSILKIGGEVGSFILPSNNEQIPEQKSIAEPVDESNNGGVVEQLIRTELKVYPNPTNGKVSVVSNRTISQLHILGVNGSIIRQASPSSTEYHGDLSGLAPGYYFIRIHLEDGSVETVKLVLQEASN